MEGGDADADEMDAIGKGVFWGERAVGIAAEMDSDAGVIGSGTFDAKVLDVGDGIVIGTAGGIGDDEAR